MSDLVLKTCHDVRYLRVCPSCKNVGDMRNMIQKLHCDDALRRDFSEYHYHARCYIACHGLEGLLLLPESQLNKVTIGDVGVEVMRKLLAQSPAADK